MTRYRIAPCGREIWVIQRRVLCFWIDVTVMTGMDYYERVTLPTKEEARVWIDRQLSHERDLVSFDAEARLRAKTTPVEVWPQE